VYSEIGILLWKMNNGVISVEIDAGKFYMEILLLSVCISRFFRVVYEESLF